MANQPMTERSFDILKILLEKGLLALLAAIALFWLNRSLDETRANGAWATELSKQRIATAEQLASAAFDLEIAQQDASSAAHAEPLDREELVSTLKTREQASLKLFKQSQTSSVLFPDSVAERFDRYLRHIDRSPPDSKSWRQESEESQKLLAVAIAELRFFVVQCSVTEHAQPSECSLYAKRPDA
jgi:hypothetical protein